MAALQEVTEEEVALERERANMVVEHTKKQLAEYDAHVAAAEKAVRDEVVTELQLLRNELELAQEAARTAAKDATVRRTADEKVANRDGRDFGWQTAREAVRDARRFPSTGL